MKKLSLNLSDNYPGLKDTHIILNPHSGTSKNNSLLIDRLRQKLGIPEDNVHLTERPGHATQIAQKIANANASILFAAGGDGTVNETARGIIDTNSVLGIIPLGSGNGFARHLNVPIRLNEIPENLPAAKISRLDVGFFEEQPFLAVSSIGFSAYVAHLFSQFGSRGPIPYFLLAIRSFFKYQPLAYSLEYDGELLTGKAFDISIANSTQYGNGAQIAPDASTEDNYLDIVLIRKPSIFELPGIAYDLFSGSLQKNRNFTYYKARNITIDVSPQTNYCHIDGEPLPVDSPSLSWRVKAKCLNVIDFR